MMLGRGLAAAAAAAILDQISKFLVLGYFGEAGCGSHRAVVTAFLDLVVTCNRGVSFGMFNQSAEFSAIVFSVAAALIVALLIYWLTRVRNAFLAVAIGLIIGGAVGNVIDRLRLGGVVDFLYFHAGSWYWPAFNVADTAICLGVAAMLLDGLLGRGPSGASKGGKIFHHDRS
jgi:signal peptidase II